jgi:hypothetical protein
VALLVPSGEWANGPIPPAATAVLSEVWAVTIAHQLSSPHPLAMAMAVAMLPASSPPLLGPSCSVETVEPVYTATTATTAMME